MRIAGIILAGGRSRRMGGPDKVTLELAGQTLAQRALDALAPQVIDIAFNSRSLPEGMDAKLVPDTVADDMGPLAGVLAGMRWAADKGATHLATAAADTPFAPTDWVTRCAAALGPEEVAMASSGGRIHPVFALWPVPRADALEAFLTVEDERKILRFAERYGLASVDFSITSGDPFFNINTPDDLAIARARIGV